MHERDNAHGIRVLAQAGSWIEMQEWAHAHPDDRSYPGDLFERGYHLNDEARDDPEFAWQVIVEVARRYDGYRLRRPSECRSAYGSAEECVLGMLGASPLEDLLGEYGPLFIDRVEQQTERSPAFAWALAGVWQNSMSDEVWSRVRKVVDRLHPE